MPTVWLDFSRAAVAAGRSPADILQAYPYLEAEDIRPALSYVVWRVEEVGKQSPFPNVLHPPVEQSLSPDKQANSFQHLSVCGGVFPFTS